MIMKAEAYAVVADSAFHFTKFDGKQHIVSEGPLSERVDLIIYTYQQYRHNEHVYIIYEYFKPSLTKFSYKYKTTGWETCSRSCGTGQQKSAVSCIRVQDKVTVNKSFCKGIEIPLYIRACRLNPCPEKYKWLFRKWQSCSKTCGGGVRVRIVVCKHVMSNAVVEDRLCPSVPPKNKEACNTNSCPKWHTSNWATCSHTCGSGMQKRTVKCIDQGTGNAVDDAQCDTNDKPDERAPCNIQPCENYIYVIQKIGKRCSKSCGGGKRIQIVNCVKNSTREPVKNIYCDGPSPPRLAVCNEQTCPEFVWKVKSSLCSQTCGNGTITREILCVNLENEQEGEESNCLAKKPAAIVNCNKGKCPDNYIYLVQKIGSICSKSCGGGKRVQIVNCVNNSTRKPVHKFYCDGPSPPRLAPCNEQKCPEFLWKVRSSSCSETCGNGTITREILCVNLENKQKGEESNCLTKKPSAIVNCNKGKCPAFKWKVHESSPCSKTCGNGTIIREIVCVNMENKKRANASDCLERKLPETVPCFLNKCVKYQVMYSSWGRCSVTCGTGVKRRTFTCIESLSRHIVSNNLCGKTYVKLERRCTSTVPCEPVDKLYCDFDRRNFCNWQNMKNSDFDWSIGKKTPSVYTGPEYDHTTKQGYFAFMEASLPRKKGEKARLYSPFIHVPRGCFSFWYHMRGEGDMGRLRVLLSSLKSNQLIFEKNGHQGIYWIQAKIYINNSGPYKLIFEATRGSGVYSDAAIDDISFQNKDCEKINKKHIRPSKIPRNCREISPYCKHRNREQYCKGSPAYRNLCCRTCPSLINKKPNITVLEFAKKKN